VLSSSPGVSSFSMGDTLEQWFIREVLAHEGALIRHLSRVWPNRSEIRDIRQEAYVRVYEAARKARPLWLEASTAHRVAFLRLDAAWQQANRLKALGVAHRPERAPSRTAAPRTDWNHYRTVSVAAGVMLVMILSVLGYHAYAADPQRIEIPAGDLTTALESLARQADVELVFRTEQLKGVKTHGVSGNLTPTQAVAKLLQGISLVIRTDASGAILISAKPTVDTSWRQRVALASVATDSPRAVTDSSEENAAVTPVHLEEIVVTAEKHATSVQHTAASIAVVSGDEATQRGEQQLDQLPAE
jgi:hypothetical protein